MNRLLLSIFWVLLTLASLPTVLAQESNWPRTLPLEQGMVTIYSLQVDEMNDDIIHFRAALAYRENAGAEPVFGAGWFESKVAIDSSNRIVHPTELKVTETRFPAGTDDVQSELAAVLARQSPAWNLDFSLDELEAALETAEAESRAVNTAPPQIVYRDHPALLISIDGEPVLREIEDSPFKAVINTPYPLIFDGKRYYLNAAKDVWYRAKKATGPYQFETRPPADIVAMVNASDAAVPDAAVSDGQTLETVTAANAPEIVVSTEPTELIVTEGPAAFVPLVDDLLVLQNSDDDVFMHVSSQNFYIVLAGRWYSASSLSGPWAYQQAEKLPKAFADIPRDSNQADSRVYVAGTEEAREAVLDAQVPQTAAVKRGEVDIEVKYDGEPVYQPVDGIGLVYIENTGSTVIQSDGLYYLVEEGVWYVSSTPNGPWQVSDHRPVQVDTILPTSPVYNAKYVQVYDSTPDVVYVGYTPGYTGSYIYRNTIVYGSGWYYSPWVSPYYYYPRYSTWGFNVRYNPWSGWNFGLSWGWGPFSLGYYSGGYWHHNHHWYHSHYGRWGPGRYRPRHHGYGYDRYGHNSYRRSGHGRRDYGRDGRGDYRPYSTARNNFYRDSSQRARIADTRDNQPRTPGNRNSDTRQANYSSVSGRRQQNAAGNKIGRSRISPVSRSDLRSKANLRDANFEDSRNRLLADNSGKVYRPTDRNPQRSVASNRRSPSSKASKNRTMPSPNRPQNVTRNSERDSGRTGTTRSTRTRTVASSRQSQTRLADNRSTQRPSRAANTSGRQPQTKKENRQRLSPTSRSTARQLKPVSKNRNAQKRPVRAVSAPAQKQNKSRVKPQPQKPQNSGRNNSAPTQRAPQNSGRNNPAPAQRAPQKSTKKTSNQRKGSDNNSRKRTGGSRSRDR